MTISFARHQFPLLIIRRGPRDARASSQFGQRSAAAIHSAFDATSLPTLMRYADWRPAALAEGLVRAATSQKKTEFARALRRLADHFYRQMRFSTNAKLVLEALGGADLTHGFFDDLPRREGLSFIRALRLCLADDLSSRTEVCRIAKAIWRRVATSRGAKLGHVSAAHEYFLESQSLFRLAGFTWSVYSEGFTAMLHVDLILELAAKPRFLSSLRMSFAAAWRHAAAAPAGREPRSRRRPPAKARMSAADQDRHFIEAPCMDAPARAKWFRMGWSRDRVRSCTMRPSGAACHDRWPVWRCAEQAQNQRRELLSSMTFYCISWPGSDRSFALTFLKRGAMTRRLQIMPGVGPITATAIETFAPPMEVFRRGRDFAAWLGLVPVQHSTGGKQVFAKTSKMGQRDIRQLLITGAMVIVRWACRKGAQDGTWLHRMLGRKPRMLVAIALANKMARSIWAMLTKGEDYRGPVATTL
jgi:hypothetical protein